MGKREKYHAKKEGMELKLKILKISKAILFDFQED